MSTSTPPSTPPEARGFVARMKASATLLTAVSGLVIAMAAAVKPRDDSATRESYDTLVKTVQEIGRENETQHDDLVSLKAYLDGFVRGSATVTPTVNGSQLTVGPSSAPSSSPAHLSTSASPPSPLPPPPPPPASPKLAAKPKPVNPPPFREVREKADLR